MCGCAAVKTQHNTTITCLQANPLNATFLLFYQVGPKNNKNQLIYIYLLLLTYQLYIFTRYLAVHKHKLSTFMSLNFSIRPCKGFYQLDNIKPITLCMCMSLPLLLQRLCIVHVLRI